MCLQVESRSHLEEWQLQKINFDQYIQSALSEFLNIVPSNILTQPNRDKYYNPEKPQCTDARLREVFHLMRDLNASALANPALGVNADGQKSFRDCLTDIARDIAFRFVGQEFIYLELGPEPVKTRFLLSRLKELGSRVAAYIGVDINPTSAVEMQTALSGILPPDAIFSRVKAFENLRPSDVRVGQRPILATMLGFQEGNDHPAEIANVLERVLMPGDYVLSEMQIAGTKLGDRPFMEFYHDPRMRRFARLALKRVIPEAASEYRFFVIPVDVGLVEPVQACVSCEEIIEPNALRGTIFVANYCLKFTSGQFRNVRGANGTFCVTDERQTGDESIVFQLARRQLRLAEAAE